MTIVARYPDSTKTSLEQRLRARARERWPQIASLHIRHRGNFSYVDATLTGDTSLKLCRLRYVGSAHDWQFAIYRASHDDYDESVFFTGLPVGTCQDALDTACGLYLNDPTAWTQHPTNLRARPLSILLMVSSAKTARFTALVAWSEVALLVWIGGRWTGASLNPARSLGPALLAHDYTSLWAYMVGPLTGAVIAVTAFDHLLPLQTLTAKLSHDSRYPSTMATRLAPDHTSASEAKLRALR